MEGKCNNTSGNADDDLYYNIKVEVNKNGKSD
jgi:hypothetical protein